MKISEINFEDYWKNVTNLQNKYNFIFWFIIIVATLILFQNASYYYAKRIEDSQKITQLAEAIHLNLNKCLEVKKDKQSCIRSLEEDLMYHLKPYGIVQVYDHDALLLDYQKTKPRHMSRRLVEIPKYLMNLPEYDYRLYIAKHTTPNIPKTVFRSITFSLFDFIGKAKNIGFKNAIDWYRHDRIFLRSKDAIVYGLFIFFGLVFIRMRQKKQENKKNIPVKIKINEADKQEGYRISTYKTIKDMRHNPRRLSRILHLFTEDNPIKYSSHSFEWSRYGLYDKFMAKLRHEFDEIDKELLQLSPNLHVKIRKFMFDEELNDKNTWGKHKIKFGWSSPELKEWCQIEERKTDGKQAIQYKLPKEFQQKVNDKTLSSFGDVCDVLKNEIEIRDDEKLIALFEKMEEDILENKFKVNYSDNFSHVSFYTDVEKFQNALKKIFEQFKKKNREQYDEIDATAIVEDKYIDILITQIGSYSTQNSSDMKRQANDGDFKDIKDELLSLCDWSIESRFKDGNFRIDYLKIGQEEVQVEPLKEAKGFTYRLRFYK